MSVPQGLSGSAAIALVQQYTEEYTFPSTTNILAFLNRGVEEVVRRIGGIRLFQSYPTTQSQTTLTLNNDVLEIVSANFSVGGNPYDQGALVYPMTQLEQATFMDAAAGFPAVGFGPPQAYFIYQDASGVLTMQLYPAAMIGQVNIYYKARPQLWADTSGSSSTNLDTSAQEAVVLFAVQRVLMNRGRGDEVKPWKDEFEAMVDDLKESINRRDVPKSGQVRDVRDRSYPAAPFWLTS